MLKLSTFQYEFNNKALLDEALGIQISEISQVNNQMRFNSVGDYLLRMLVAKSSFFYFRQLQEGGLTTINNEICNDEPIKRFASVISLQDFVDSYTFGKKVTYSEDLAIRVRALLAALYFDGGIACAEEFIIGYVEAQIEEIAKQRNYKSNVQELAELLQQHKSKQPVYTLTEKNDSNGFCTVGISVDGRVIVTAQASSVSAAQQCAAGKALEIYSDKAEISPKRFLAAYKQQ